ncbi:AAA family ATPase [Lacisediminihabitans profunda]|uniref:AAA family ATPase n=2 Tax=Lacisediminihabitans profunda TaxID=2594790 RepID=A0A5C8UNV9_9MICO|nr:AAA family ATPase [Lacisediminihabitans profunda]
MRLVKITVNNYARLQDLDVAVRGHLVVVGANDVGKTSLLRLLNLLFGATAQLYQGLSIRDLRDPNTPLTINATFNAFSEDERTLFHREIDIDPADKSESLDVRLEVQVDPEDPESVLISRWCPGRGEVRPPSREQLVAFGWRYLPAVRTSSANQLEGSNGAVQVLLKAVESELGDEKAALGSLLDSFNDKLEESKALTTLREGMAEHLSNSMPRSIDANDLSIRTSADPTESVLENVSMYFSREGAFVPLSEQSDGIRQLISMTLFDLAEGAANVIAIDEPELHLHPLSQRTVAELLTQQVNQKILVTHSPYVVQKFDPTQVVAVSPDGTCHQIDPAQFSVEERTQAHWWSPRMLEALTARFAILVEGIADRLIVEAVAHARGLSLDRIGAIVFELGGAENFPTVYKLLGPHGFNVQVLGLVDEAESPRWVGAVGGKPKHVIGRDVFISKVDLEEEYCRALGAPEVAQRLITARVAQESGVLSSCGVSTLADVGVTELAKFCRSSTKTANRKVPAALAISKSLTADDALKIDSVSSLVARLQTLSSK